MADVNSMNNQDQIVITERAPAPADQAMPWEIFRPWSVEATDQDMVTIAHLLMREPYGVCSPYDGLS